MLIPEFRQVIKKRTRLLIILLTACAMVPLITGITLAQAKKPISKNGLLEAIRLNGLSTKELIEQIQVRGVSFEMTAADEEEFRTAGARPELMDAVRANYRSATPVKPNNSVSSDSGNKSGNNSRSPANVPAGPPLAKNEVVTLLQGGLPSDRVQQFVEVRGVTFAMTPLISREITAAGGNPSLISAISSRGTTSNGNDSGKEIFKGGLLGVKVTEVTTTIASQLGLTDLSGAYVEAVDRGGPAERGGVHVGDVVVEFNGGVVNGNTLPTLVANAPARSQATLTVIRNKHRQLLRVVLGEQIELRGPDYDELTDQAIGAIRANDGPGAIKFLQQAIQINPDQPTAYVLLGSVELYGMQDMVSAEQAMRSAIDRGGSAVFRVYHDHDGGFNQVCVGSIFISKTGVTYKGDDGIHALEATRADINEAKVNSVMGAQYGAFHIRANQGGKKNNYNFAPFTRKVVESNLILKLIQSYH